MSGINDQMNARAASLDLPNQTLPSGRDGEPVQGFILMERAADFLYVTPEMDGCVVGYSGDVGAGTVVFPTGLPANFRMTFVQLGDYPLILGGGGGVLPQWKGALNSQLFTTGNGAVAHICALGQYDYVACWGDVTD